MTAIRVATVADARALGALRTQWLAAEEPGFADRMAAWLDEEGDRRTTWIAEHDDAAAGMASLFEYRRMPKPGRADERWGYVANMFVIGGLRGRGIGRALLDALVATADERRYVRLVLSPSERALRFYARAGFVQPAGDDRLLVRPRRA